MLQFAVIAAAFPAAGVLCAAGAAEGRGTGPPRHAALWEQAAAVLREGLDLRAEAFGDPGNWGDEHMAGALLRNLELTRVAAARELVRDGNPRALEVLKEYLADERTCLNHRQSRQGELIAELHAVDPRAAREVVATILGRETISEKYQGAAEALRLADAAAARAALEQAIAGERVVVVAAFFGVAAEKAERLPAEAVEAMLKSRSASIRLMGACVRAGTGDASVIPELKAAMAARRTNAIQIFGDQRLAVRALGELYAQGGRAALLELLPDARPYSGLGATFGDLAMGEIMERATADDLALLEKFGAIEGQRYYAFEAVIRVSPEAARDWSLRGVEDKNINVRLLAALQLARAGDEKAIALLEECCYQDLGVGGKAGGYLLAARHDKARAAYLRVFNFAAEPVNDLRHRAALGNDGFGYLEDVPGVLPEVLAMGTDRQRQALWDSLSGRRWMLTRIEPVLAAALAARQYDALIGAVRNAALENDAEKSRAAKLLTDCLDSGSALAAAKVGRERRILPDAAVRGVARRLLVDASLRPDCVALLAKVGTEEDLALLAAGLASPTASAPRAPASHQTALERVNTAVAIRRILARTAE